MSDSKRLRSDPWADLQSVFHTPGKASTNPLIPSDSLTPQRKSLQNLGSHITRLSSTSTIATTSHAQATTTPQVNSKRKRERSPSPVHESSLQTARVMPRPIQVLTPQPQPPVFKTPLTSTSAFKGKRESTPLISINDIGSPFRILTPSRPLTFLKPLGLPIFKEEVKVESPGSKKLLSLSAHQVKADGPGQYENEDEQQVLEEEVYMTRLRVQGPSLAGRLAKLVAKHKAGLGLFHSNLSQVSLQPESVFNTADVVLTITTPLLPIVHEGPIFRCLVNGINSSSSSSMIKEKFHPGLEVLVSFLPRSKQIHGKTTKIGLDPVILAKIMKGRQQGRDHEGDPFVSPNKRKRAEMKGEKTVVAGLWSPVELVSTSREGSEDMMSGKVVTMVSRYIILET